MSTSSVRFSEEYVLTEEDQFVCRVVHLINRHYDEGALFSVNGRVTICSRSVPGSPPVLDDTSLLYDVNGLLSCPLIYVHDFQVPVNIRSKGVARFVWHRIYSTLPPELRERTFVAGKLVRKDASPENGGRRDLLWKDLCGASRYLTEAVFTADSETSDGRFRGPLSDPWQPSKSKLRAEQLSADKVEPHQTAASGKQFPETCHTQEFAATTVQKVR